MNEEELFCKLFPEYIVNGKPLSPYFDLFESGYEQSEKRIEELQETNNELKGKLVLSDMVLTDKTKHINELEDKLIKKVTLESFDVVSGKIKQGEKAKKQLAKAKEIINIGVEGLKHWGIVAGYERPFAKEAEKLFNLFLDKAEQFLKETQGDKDHD